MIRISVLLVLFCLLLTNCTTTGGTRALKAETSETLQVKIIEGKTTKGEIREKFGPPTQTSFTDNGSEIYRYELTELQAKAVNYVPVANWFAYGYEGTKKSLTILFDKKDLVTRYTLDQSPVDTTQRGNLQNILIPLPIP
jgi:hypothetical protein